jgi:transcriptional regulator with XRE-family HTH domain
MRAKTPAAKIGCPQLRTLLEIPPLRNSAPPILLPLFGNRSALTGDVRSHPMIPDPTNAPPLVAPRDREVTAEAVRELLRVNGFTLYRVAALTRARYPHQAAYHIRRNFYSQLRSGLSPTFQQVLALAELTGSRLWDCLANFGFSLSDIPRLQAVLPRRRTGLIDKDLVDPQGLLPFLRYRRPGATLPATAPLSQLLEPSGSYPALPLIAPAHGDFVYAKIGTEDILAFPELLPGSIVRANPRLVGSFLPEAPSQRSRPLFLVEHRRGLNCGRLRVRGPNRVAFVTSDPSLANVEFRLGTEARILGVVDLELRFRPASGRRRGTVDATARISPDLAEPWNPKRIETRTSRSGALLETARLRAGLSFRSASKLSRVVAKILGDDRYFASSSTLSDYEAGDKLPRHIHKLFTLATVYSFAFRNLLRSFGIAIDDLGNTTAALETKTSRARIRQTKEELRDGFFEKVRNEFGHLPLFLANALPTLSGLAHISLRDVFWFGGETNPLHPSLRGAFFALVNRRSKKPRIFSGMPLCTQPLYLLQQRGGSYLAASCAIENERLVLYAYPQGFTEVQPVRRHIDADVVGQVVGIARSLLSPP